MYHLHGYGFQLWRCLCVRKPAEYPRSCFCASVLPKYASACMDSTKNFGRVIWNNTLLGRQRICPALQAFGVRQRPVVQIYSRSQDISLSCQIMLWKPLRFIGSWWRVAAPEVRHADVTTLQVLYELAKEPKSYMWLYWTSGDIDRPIVMYAYQTGRDTVHPKNFWRDSTPISIQIAMLSTTIFQKILRRLGAGHICGESLTKQWSLCPKAWF